MRNEGKEERKTEEVRELCPGAKLKLVAGAVSKNADITGWQQWGWEESSVWTMGTSKVQVFCRSEGGTTLKRRVERTKKKISSPSPYLRPREREGKQCPCGGGAGLGQGHVEGTFREEAENVGI